MTCGRSVKELIIVVHLLLYFLVLINCQRSLDRLLPDHSKIAPQFLPNRSPVCWSCAVEILPFLKGCKLEPSSYKDSLSWSRSLFSEWLIKKLSRWISIILTLHPQTTKRSASSAESREIYLSTYDLTKSKWSKPPTLFGYTFRRWYSRSSLWTPPPHPKNKHREYSLCGG